MDTSVKIARLQARQETTRLTVDLVKSLISNPIVELVGGIWLVDWLASKETNAFKRYLAEQGGELTVAGIIGLQQLGGSNVTALGTKILGLLK